ncbi:hypothetical protein GM658_19515 [Pseudoduganella eburnea]|uniref:Uncharacterized protein n=1 Tax=Massilia eburnea TaxID=1776165 RepID=A0A6L6QKW3_9BURK|nr:hypothetical protein [Massilia eburnea]MTW12801.1 hypothetical protein [Massilia eburnea]
MPSLKKSRSFVLEYHCFTLGDLAVGVATITSICSGFNDHPIMPAVRNNERTLIESRQRIRMVELPVLDAPDGSGG